MARENKRFFQDLLHKDLRLGWAYAGSGLNRLLALPKEENTPSAEAGMQKYRMLGGRGCLEFLATLRRRLRWSLCSKAVTPASVCMPAGIDFPHSGNSHFYSENIIIIIILFRKCYLRKLISTAIDVLYPEPKR